MSEAQRNIITTHGWDYFEMPTWQPIIHFKFPAHLRVQSCAVAVSLTELAPVLGLIVKAIDALERQRELEI